MSFTNPSTSFVQNYGQNVLMMAQQMESKLRPLVMNETATGERFYFELYNTNSAMSQVTTRFEDKQNTDTLFERRAVDLLDYDDSKMVDSFDKLKMLIDPTSPIVAAQAAQMGRQIDDIIIASLYADMKTGKTGSSTSSLTNTVAINSWAYGSGSGNANVTISKLIEAAAVLNNADVPMEDRYFVLDPINHAKLLATAEATSADFVTAKNLVTGQVEGLVGFKLIQSTRLPVDGSGYRRCFAWNKTGMGLVTAQNPKISINKRTDKRGEPWEAYISLSMAATRLENSKVVEVKALAT